MSKRKQSPTPEPEPVKRPRPDLSCDFSGLSLSAQILKTLPGSPEESNYSEIEVEDIPEVESSDDEPVPRGRVHQADEVETPDEPEEMEVDRPPKSYELAKDRK